MPKKSTRPTAKQLAAVVQTIERRIYIIRGQKVMVDADLADLYQVPTKRFNEQVRRNPDRFPGDFRFQLTRVETLNLRSQIATSSWGGRRSLPQVFTEHGVAMLSAVLNSQRAVQMSIQIVRAFVKLREFLAGHKDLGLRLDRVEATQKRHGSVINILVGEVQNLKRLPPVPSRKRFGFKTGE